MTTNSTNCAVPDQRQFSAFEFVLTERIDFRRYVPGFVYVIQADAGDPVKIGLAIDPIQRLADLQCAHWKVLSLTAVAGIFDNAPLVEKTAHAIAAKHRLIGEWFDLSVLEAVEVIQKAALRSRQIALPARIAIQHAHNLMRQRISDEVDASEAERRRQMRRRLGMDE